MLLFDVLVLVLAAVVPPYLVLGAVVGKLGVLIAGVALLDPPLLAVDVEGAKEGLDFDCFDLFMVVRFMVSVWVQTFVAVVALVQLKVLMGVYRRSRGGGGQLP